MEQKMKEEPSIPTSSSWLVEITVAEVQEAGGEDHVWTIAGERAGKLQAKPPKRTWGTEGGCHASDPTSLSLSVCVRPFSALGFAKGLVLTPFYSARRTTSALLYSSKIMKSDCTRTIAENKFYSTRI